MKPKLRPIDRQVIVITGASSGIGLATALAAAAQGASLVIAARRGATPQAISAQIEERGGNAVAVTVDVGRREEVDAVAARAIEAFGGHAEHAARGLTVNALR